MRGFPFLLFFGFVPLLFIEDYFLRHSEQARSFELFKYSYITFFTWNALTTWWIWNSTIFGAIMAITINSLFMAVVFQIYHLTRRNLINPERYTYLLIFIWITFEYLHLDWDLSWPWLNLGNGFAMYPRIIQWYEYTGIFGGSLWILSVNILIFQLLKNLLIEKFRLPQTIFLTILILFLVAVPVLISLRIYHTYREEGVTAEVIVTQPNSDPYTEQYTLTVREVIDRNFGLAEPLITDSTVFIVCPESALQENIWHHSLDETRSIELIRRFLTKYPQLNIVVGASTFRLFRENEPLTRTARKFSDIDLYYEAYNTALFINDSGPVELYHKSKLVPGPEKMPFQKLLSPLQQIAFDLGGTVGSLGLSPERTVFTSKCGRFKVPAIICYESVYGEFVGEFVRNGANLLFIITNDGWWGNTPGHRQHFSFALLRAIETRRSIARSANTGISAIINQRGDIVLKTAYWVPDVIKASLVTNEKITFYVKYGDYIGRISTFLSLMVILGAITNHILKRKRIFKKS